MRERTWAHLLSHISDDGVLKLARAIMGDKTRGLIPDKFYVERSDGQSEQGEKHDGCEYFVLDLDHDPYAIPALKAYAEACRDEYPHLARDLDIQLAGLSRETTEEAG